MISRSKSLSLIAFAALVLASLACQAVQGSPSENPTESSSATEEANPFAPATEIAVEPFATEDASGQGGGIYDGNWTGTNTVDDKEILFVVENDEVVSFNLNYTGESSGCTYHGAVSAGSRTSSSVDSGVIEGDEFSLVYTSINDELTFTGTFTSDSEANGTLHIKSSADGLCGEYEKEISWTASKGSSADVEPAATDDPGALFSDDDSVALVTGFFDAVNAGDVDSAIGMVDDGIMFSIGEETLFDSGELEAYLRANKGTTFEISGVQSFGGAIIDFDAKSSDGTDYSTCSAFITDGKISMVTMTP